MLTKRIIPCLDVKAGHVVKGVRFQHHKIMGDIEAYAEFYQASGADELVFYDITASSDERLTDKAWVTRIAKILNIPFCVAGGIRSIKDAEIILAAGADKISINSPALENPSLITKFAKAFGSQCVVVGIDSYQSDDNRYYINQYSGDAFKSRLLKKKTEDWISEVQDLGAGEIVLNCINQDGVKRGYDIEQLLKFKDRIKVPFIASGGAGKESDFYEVFVSANVDGALAASVFHERTILINELKLYLTSKQIAVRPLSI